MDLEDVGVLLPLLVGIAYCIWSWRWIRQVRLDDCHRRDEHLDIALLQHRRQQIEAMINISALVSRGANAFLMEHYRYMRVFIVVCACVVAFFVGFFGAVAFIVGCGTATLAGYVGMKVAIFSTPRTTHECWRSLESGFVVALHGGFVTSFALVILGLCSFFALFTMLNEISGLHGEELWVALSCCSFGISCIGLFSRVGGGIYTKAADIGADLTGKLEFGLSEDDYRNPACIADNVGDNVGGVIAIGADLLSSLAGANCAALVLAAAGSCKDVPNIMHNRRALAFPLLVSSSSILSSLLALAVVLKCYRIKDVKSIELVFRRLIVVGALFQMPLVYLLAWWCLPERFAMSCIVGAVTPWDCTICCWLGVWSSLVVHYSAEHFTSYKCKPVTEIAEAQRVSAASGVIVGLAIGYSSCAPFAICLAVTALISQILAGPYGVALAAAGLLSSMPLGLAVDAYDSIADNANGIAEMSGLDSNVREIIDVLGGGGAVGTAFAIGSAALVCHALTHAFWMRAGVGAANAMDRWYFCGLLIGAMLPYAFSAITMKSVSNAALAVVEECRAQFPRIINNFARPDYDRCVKICTKASHSQMGPAGLLVIGTPIATGLVFGKVCAAGLLQGSLVSGVQMAMSMISTGGAWDNAKKLVTLTQFNKESEHYRNAVIGDIVGDPLKDVSGPSLNVLMNLSSITTLVFATVIHDWSREDGGPFWETLRS